MATLGRKHRVRNRPSLSSAMEEVRVWSELAIERRTESAAARVRGEPGCRGERMSGCCGIRGGRGGGGDWRGRRGERESGGERGGRGLGGGRGIGLQRGKRWCLG
ncbi:hypothetical protein U1Q18_012533 [Sarracenia purpurea var. burkii]